MSLTFFTNKESLIILWIIGLIIFNKETVNASKNLLKTLAIWLAYFLINTILIRSFHPFFMFTYFAKIMIAYWLLMHYKSKIFVKYEDVIYILTLLSLFFYTIQVIAPDQMFNVFKIIDLSGNLYPKRDYASISLYTYHISGMYDFFPRNAGFTWEPGPFSCYIALAVFFNIARNNMKLYDKKRLIIFLIGIITTQSTTGFIALLVILLWLVWERFRHRAIIVIAAPISIIIVVILFITIPWLQEKIMSESQQDIEGVLSDANKYKISQTPGRFASLQLRLEDFKKYPIAGFGGNTKLQTGYIYDDLSVSAISGIGTILGRYGSIGMFLFLWLTTRTGMIISEKYQIYSKIIFPILILIIGFSFNIIEAPILFTLIISSVFLKVSNQFGSKNQKLYIK